MGPMSGSLSVTFWGVRGSIACPGRRYERYGGNTSCLEIRCGAHVLVFDAGTGLRPLGEKLKAEGKAIKHRQRYPWHTVQLWDGKDLVHTYEGDIQATLPVDTEGEPPF